MILDILSNHGNEVNISDMLNLWRQKLRPAENNKRQLISYNAGRLGYTRCWFRLHSHVATAVFINRQATKEFA